MKSLKKYYRSLCSIVIVSLLVAAVALYGVPACANMVTTDRTEVTLTSNISAVAPSQSFWLALHIRMQPGWHTYWINPGDSGMTPTLEWTLPNGFTTGNMQFPPPDRLQTGDLVDYGYNNEAWILVPVTAPVILRDNAVSILALKARWLVCNDVCIPESGDFSLAIPTAKENQPGPDTDAVMDMVKKLPVSVQQPLGFSVEKGKINFDFPLKDIPAGDVKSAEFYPAHADFIVNNARQEYDIGSGNIAFSIPAEKGDLVDKTNGLVSVYLKDGSRRDFSVSMELGSPRAVMGFGLLKALASALLGGLILNLMPCVFPILSLKALVVAKKAEKRPREVRIHGIVYTLGVMASFLTLAAILIFIQIGGHSIGWGYHMQSPEFIAALVAVFFLIGLNLSGFFEIPGLFGNVGGDMASRDNLIGSFVTGALAVLVATPCTAPFMATAVGFALTQTAPAVVLIFAFLGLGMASPFLLISLHPQLISWLPKPGQWMSIFRQALAYPMYLCTIWLLWVLIREVGTDALFVVLAGLVFLAFAVWLNTIDSFLSGISGIAIGLIALTVIIGCGHFAGHPAPDGVTEKYSAERLAELRGQHRAVFVDATADWCITCKVNENIALSSHKVRRRFAEKGITTLVADWTHGDDDITAYLKSFGRAGVPIYVYYPPDGDPVILPQVLTPSIVLREIE